MSDPRTGPNVISFPAPGGGAGAPPAPTPALPGPPGPPPPAAMPQAPPAAPPPQPGAPAGAAPAGLPMGAMPPLPPAPPGYIINPAFQQWRMLSQLWHAEDQRRKTQFEAACRLIRHDVCLGYKVDIEADSTVAADEQAEKQARTEFLQAIIPMMQLLIPEAQANPGSVPLIHALVMFGVRAFPAARALEQEFEEAFHTLFQTPPQPQPQKGNVKSPDEIQSEERIAQGEQQVDQQKNQIAAAQVQVAQQKNAITMFQNYMKAQSDRQTQQQEGLFRAAELAQQGQELQSRQDLDRARLTHLISRDATGLV